MHLVRNPLRVAKSEASRSGIVHRWRMPRRNYRGADGKLYFRRSLTGLEPIFSHVAGARLTPFQWYAVQWIEIENRAMRFQKQHGKERDCFALHSTAELNDAAKLRALLDFLDLPRSGDDVLVEGGTNRVLKGQTQIGESDRREFAEVVRLLPASYLTIFQEPPYCRWDWAEALSR